MHLRKGKTRNLVDRSIDAALMAVEIYNKPRTSFRVEAYITQMIIAWTRLLHAYFNQTIGNKFYYKEHGKYKIVDGERKAWELKTCIIKYGNLSEPVKSNLDFFIKLRNKIEHRTIDRDEIGVMIFGECQALLYNYENELIKLFGNEFALNENLAFSLQFSTLRTGSQNQASKKLLSNEVIQIKDFIEKYRMNIQDDVFNTQEFSIKLIQVPKISNTSRNDLAIEFVNWSSLSDIDKASFEKISTLIKDKVIKKEAINPGKLKPGRVITDVNKISPIKINHRDHKCILAIFGIRPYREFDDAPHDPFETNTKYCHYDEAHNDYLYQESWAEFLKYNLLSGKLSKTFWREHFEKKSIINIKEFEPPSL